MHFYLKNIKMKHTTAFIFIMILFHIIGCSEQKPGAEIMSQKDWLKHLNNDLIPFWTTTDAYGTPVGNFPTFRCNDGTLGNCNELLSNNVPEWILNQTDSLKRIYFRTISRQSYFYGVAFHLTGNTDYLVSAKAGVDFIRKHIQANGLIYSYFNKNTLTDFGPDSTHITSQDLAYSLTGLAFYYYLTRDPDVLKDIVLVNQYIFSNYTQPNGFIKWTLCNDRHCESSKTELVAYLDQLNSYLLLLAPIINDEQLQLRFKKQIEGFCLHMMDTLFCNETSHLIYGRIKNQDSLSNPNYVDPLRKIGSMYHTDYGMTAKTYWTILLAGEMYNNEEDIEFAKANLEKIIEAAYLDEGAWSISPLPEEKNAKRWWIYAELDQAACILNFDEQQNYTKFLSKTQRFWLRKFVDHKGGKEIFSDLDEHNNPMNGLKIHHWKNGFHSAEHTLFGIIQSAYINNERLNLFYAFNANAKPDNSKIQPHYFEADITSKDSIKFKNEKLSSIHEITKVQFLNIRMKDAIDIDNDE
jgi:hypothetical protein